jgi:hypothetical protein
VGRNGIWPWLDEREIVVFGSVRLADWLAFVLILGSWSCECARHEGHEGDERMLHGRSYEAGEYWIGLSFMSLVDK